MDKIFEERTYDAGMHNIFWKSEEHILILEGSGKIHSNFSIKTSLQHFRQNSLLSHDRDQTLSLEFYEPAKIGVISFTLPGRSNNGFVNHTGGKGILFRQAFELGQALEKSDTARKDAAINSVFEIISNLIMDAFEELHSINNDIVLTILRNAVYNLKDPDYDIYAEIRKTNYCETYMRKLIVRETGLTPVQFLTGVRIDKAISLILNNQDNLSITEVASRCGFKDPLYFSRKFRKLTGFSPTEYRKKYNLMNRQDK